MIFEKGPPVAGQRQEGGAAAQDFVGIFRGPLVGAPSL